MEALGLFWLCIAVIVYCGLAFLVAWWFTPRLGERYGYIHGPDSESKLLWHVWLILMPVGLVLSLLVMVFMPEHVTWGSRLGAVAILAVFAPTPAAIAVTKRVGEYLIKGAEMKRCAVISQYTA